MPTPPVRNPAGYVTPVAIGVTDQDGNLVLVGNDMPLPVGVGAASPGTPILGNAASDGLFGPFAPTNGNPIIVELGGTWSGSVRLVRSVDDGVTVSNLLVAGTDWGVYRANGVEQAWVETDSAATFYLAVTLDSGSVDYRVSQ